MTMEQRGSVLLAIELLARSLAFDDRDCVSTAQTQLDALFPRERGGELGEASPRA